MDASDEHGPRFEPGCEEAIHRLYHFLDGELTLERRTAIRHHLDECSPCVGAFEFEAEIRMLVASKCRDEVPDGLRQRIALALSHHDHEVSSEPGIPPAEGGF